MSETAADNSIDQRLRELNQTFNTNKGFGLMGMIDNTDPQSAHALSEFQRDGSPDPELIKEFIAPVNDSLQSLKNETLPQIEKLRSEMEQLKQFQQPQQQAAQAAPPAQAQPPEDPQDRRIWEIEQANKRLRADVAYERARGGLREVINQYPDAGLSEAMLQDVWKRYNLSDNIQAAETTDWGQHWKLVASDRMNPKLMEELNKAKAELNSLKSNRPNPMEDLGAVPRTRRQAASLPTLQQSGEYPDDVYERAGNRLGKGRFMGFAKALAEEMQAKQLRSAV